MMNKEFKTEQERFWAGEFGTQYIERNRDHLPAKISLFSKILHRATAISSAIEFGPNIGSNLVALKTLLPMVEVSGVEVNKDAYGVLKQIPGIEAFNQSILEFDTDKKFDLSFFSGVLIHINPEFLPRCYDLLYKTSKKYIMVSEYYNPVPVTFQYRGHTEKAFKRDFAGEIMDRFPDLTLVD